MESLEAELERARELKIARLADAIEAIGFECTRCGACCKAAGNGDCGDGTVGDGDKGSEPEPEHGSEEHTATIFPDEVRQLQESGDYDWRDIARPMPYGLADGEHGPAGETFEWALQTDGCGDCVFYEEDDRGGRGACTVHEDRPLICRTYPFSVTLAGTSQPMGGTVDRVGQVRAHECEGLGRDISRDDAEELARALRERAIRELEEAIGVRENYEPANRGSNEVVVHDSEGQKRPDGTTLHE